MANYHYRCNDEECGYEFETFQSIHADSLTHCDECEKETLQRVIYAAAVCTKVEPKTLGHLADRNRDNMGNYEYQEKSEKLAERKRRGKQQVSDEAVKLRKDWGRPETTDRRLGTLTPKQKKKYVEKGELPF